MADSKHTPGPWYVEPQQDGASWEICTGTRGAWIMLLRSTAEATDEERAEDLANATLMGAAPELLESLKEILDLCAIGDVDESTEAYGWGDAIKDAKSAIAKTTGGTNHV